MYYVLCTKRFDFWVSWALILGAEPLYNLLFLSVTKRKFIEAHKLKGVQKNFTMKIHYQKYYLEVKREFFHWSFCLLYIWMIRINFAIIVLILCRIEGLIKIVAKSNLPALHLPDFLNISCYSLWNSNQWVLEDIFGNFCCC